MLILAPATSTLADLVRGVDEDQLGQPTPCSETTIGALLDHVSTFASVFAAAATKTPLASGSQAPQPDGSNLGPGWHDRIPGLVQALGQAWMPATAWEGMTEAGGQVLPSEVAGVIALDEVIVHGWDIAVSSGQPYSCDLDLIEAAMQFVQSTVGEHPDGTPGLFGPPVPVSEHAPSLDRLIGLTGRDPSWNH